jgi:hypothetical protein
MAAMLAPSGSEITSRQAFLDLPLYQQKQLDLRLFFHDAPGDGALKARCIRPDHRDLNPSLLISDDHAHCFGCDSFWWPDQFLRELGDRQLAQLGVGARPRPGPRFIPMPMVKTYNRWLNTHYKHRLEWLYARGLRLEAINANLLGYDGQSFVIPVIEDGTVHSLRFRRDDQWEDELENPRPKYWGLAGKNKAALYKPVIPEWVTPRSTALHLCEGELDALRLAQEGLPAWSLTNGCRAFRSEHVPSFSGKRVKVVYDQDRAGREASDRVCRFLRAKNVVWPEVLGKDVTEFLQRWSLEALLNHL